MRYFYAFLDSVYFGGPDARLRDNFIFDAMTEERFNSGEEVGESAEGLFMIRLMTTRARLKEIAVGDVGSDSFEEGGWYKLGLEEKENHPRVWLYELEGGAVIKSSLVEIKKLNKIQSSLEGGTNMSEGGVGGARGVVIGADKDPL